MRWFIAFIPAAGLALSAAPMPAELDPPVTHFEDVKPNHCRMLQHAWAQRGLKLTTIRNYRMASNTMFEFFVKFGNDYGLVDFVNPWGPVKPPEAAPRSTRQQLARKGSDDEATMPLDQDAKRGLTHVVGAGNSTRLAERLRAAGNDATAVLYPRVGHYIIVAALAPLVRLLVPVLRDCEDFIARTLARHADAQATS